MELSYSRTQWVNHCESRENWFMVYLDYYLLWKTSAQLFWLNVLSGKRIVGQAF